jgi:integrase
MSRKSGRGTVNLPKGVHRIVSRSREYFYFQANRGTLRQGPRIVLPNDPHAPEFWNAIRQAQGIIGPVATDTVNALIDAYIAAWPTLPKTLATGTQYQYRRSLDLARKPWGDLRAKGVRPVHVRTLMDSLADTPAKANAFLGAMRALSAWALTHDHIEQSLIEGVRPYERKEGHRPWSPEQIRCAHEHLTGAVRRGVMLYIYTGQRGSDIVRLGWTDIDDGGFRLRQKKTGREVWCPIVPELAAEMATWEKRPGPFLLQEDGRAKCKPFTRAHFWQYFDKARAKLPALADTTLHGLRATAVIRLRQHGLSTGQIGDVIGMSLPMIERYCRFADKKASGKAALFSLAARTREEQNCKIVENCKTQS